MVLGLMLELGFMVRVKVAALTTVHTSTSTTTDVPDLGVRVRATLS